ncbi:MAG TPA: SGNH/GDSL hydrolase family protein [Elusimicrobiota bacterium]|nr:SGNH/GDSL hydrolase family protein [Elusimicrobiota bacterium]
MTRNIIEKATLMALAILGATGLMEVGLRGMAPVRPIRLQSEYVRLMSLKPVRPSPSARGANPCHPIGGILCLGDSFTYGIGVEDDETYPRYLEEEISKRKTGCFRAVNAGIQGTQIVHHIRHYKELAPTVDHQILIYLFSRGNYPRILADRLKGRLDEILWRHTEKSLSRSHVYRLCRRGISWGIDRYYESAVDRRGAAEDKAKELYRAGLSELIGMANGRGVRVLVVGHDMADPSDRLEPIPAPGVTVSVPGDDYRLPDGHLNKFGNRVLAEKIYNALIEFGYIG